MTKEELQARIDAMKFTYVGRREEVNLKSILSGLNSESGSIWGGITGDINDQTDLISGGKILTSLLPALVITDTFVEASQAAMLALTAETGDICIRTDLTQTYILKGTDPSVLADWELLLTPTGGVVSVFGRSGAVTAQSGDYSFSLISGVVSTSQGGAPAGGSSGYVLTKNSATDYDYSWTAAAGGLPSMTGNNGKYLTTDGTSASWGAVIAGAAGSNTQIQFNSAGSLSASSNFVWDNTNKRLGIWAAPTPVISGFPGATLSFGKQPVGVGAWFLYEAGAGLNYGFGFNALEFQQFVPSNAIMTWSSGGDMNATTGVNEKMRLTMSTGVLKIPGGISISGNNIYADSSGNFKGKTFSAGLNIGVSHYCYEGAAGVRYGIGVNSNEFQYFIATAAHFSWNKGGDLQSSGSNELMRLDNSGSLLLGTSSVLSSSILTLSSTTRGLLLPRMTSSQKNAITSPAEGLVVYDNTLHKLCLYTGSAWETITSA